MSGAFFLYIILRVGVFYHMENLRFNAFLSAWSSYKQIALELSIFLGDLPDQKTIPSPIARQAFLM